VRGLDKHCMVRRTTAGDGTRAGTLIRNTLSAREKDRKTVKRYHPGVTVGRIPAQAAKVVKARKSKVDCYAATPFRDEIDMVIWSMLVEFVISFVAVHPSAEGQAWAQDVYSSLKMIQTCASFASNSSWARAIS
jgi:hypothetical protein